MKKTALFLFLFFLYQTSISQILIDHLEPPFWWIGMKNSSLQLMIHGKDIGKTTPSLKYEGVNVKEAINTGTDYLFLTLTITPTAQPGTFSIDFREGDKVAATRQYELKARASGSAERQGFNTSDLIYLIMPDRFANGDPGNDNMPGMLEKADRNNPNGRHGGDIQGIKNHLDYLQKIGVTAIWNTPLLENNMPAYSYHGYAITDLYKIDPRFGTNESYRDLVDAAHAKGIKVIMDMVFNHFGTNSYWMKDLPQNDWVNQWPEFTRSNYRAGVITDPYHSNFDENKMEKGWFDVTMADFNQKNPLVANYLIQNSIWWIEFAGLDGIRQDTYPYPDKDFMARWMKAVRTEYPNFNTVGEAWLNTPAQVAYWQDRPKLKGADKGKGLMNGTEIQKGKATPNNRNNPRSNGNDKSLDKGNFGANKDTETTKDQGRTYLTDVFDFPLMFAIQAAFNEEEGWASGMTKLYELLSMDFVYPNPNNLITFADNHDIERMYPVLKTVENVKMALAFLATTRGIPLIYYGTEALSDRGDLQGDPGKRKDFPGGWDGDKTNMFTAQNLSADQKDVSEYLAKLFTWRKGNKTVQQGKLTHYIPEDGIYVYFRTLGNEAVMVIMNNNKVAKTLATKRFEENLNGFRRGRDVMGGNPLNNLQQIDIPAKNVKIIELSK